MQDDKCPDCKGTKKVVFFNDPAWTVACLRCMTPEQRKQEIAKYSRKKNLIKAK